jgi:thiamine-phosphate pyrophosphorylase
MSPQRARAGAAGIRGVHVLADDAPRWKLDPVEQARAACQGGAAVVQLRAKSAGDREALVWAAEIRRATREAGALFIVNDRFDLALAAEADGVHLGQDDLPPACIPAGAREKLLVGLSTHDEAQAREAAERGDYVAFGPIFSTDSKATAMDSQGVEQLARIVARISPHPVVAIGGIAPQNAAAIARTGAAAIAVIAAVAGADDPPAAVRALVRAFETAA